VPKSTKGEYLNTERIQRIAEGLIRVADRYPLTCRTEENLQPVLAAILASEFGASRVEHAVEGGRIDYKVGTANATLLELAVAPRRLIDKDNKALVMPGHGVQAAQLSAGQNEPELVKLAAIPQARAKKRCLLLIDLRKRSESHPYRDGYIAWRAANQLANPILVVYVSRTKQWAQTLRRHP
jgi:hypothetical protein